MKLALKILFNFQLSIFQLIGFAPFKIKILEKNKITFKCTQIYKCYNLILILFLVSINIYILPRVFVNLYNEKETFLSRLLGLVLSYSSTVIIIIICLLYVFQQRKFIKIINQFTEVDLTLNRLKNIDKIDDQSTKIMFIIIFNLFFCTSVIICEIFLNEQFHISFFLYLYQFLAFSFYVIQYAILLTIIEKRFKSINGTFFKLKDSIAAQQPIENIRKYIIYKICIVEIIVLKRSHTKLFSMCSEIANFYSFGMLFMVPFIIVSIIINIYELLIPIITFYVYPDLMLRHVNQFSWMAMTLFPTLMVAMVASQIEEQMKKTGNIVQKILQECSMSPEIRRELKIFSLELLHRDFQFTAYNIIPVDCTILRTIFGAVATYLIIFIQFQADDGK
ncbi:hypothetical protein G9C98_008562, partial [Cotesia typhae]